MSSIPYTTQSQTWNGAFIPPPKGRRVFPPRVDKVGLKDIKKDLSEIEIVKFWKIRFAGSSKLMLSRQTSPSALTICDRDEIT